jgi:hypothetical protein
VILALIPASFRPGIFKEASDLGAGDVAAWSDGNRVRFWKGQPQPIGGWQTQTVAGTFLGEPRNTTDWTSINGTKYLAVGTHKKIYVVEGDTYFDITPQRDSGSLGTDPFTTTSGSSIVRVAHTAHGIGTKDTCVRFAGAATFNGVDMVGEWPVVEIVDANTYDVESGQSASATGAGGGASVTYEYDIDAGGKSGAAGLGWGAGPWGAGTWGTARASSDVFFIPRTWALTNFGEDLIFNPRGGGIYRWDTSAGTGTRAAVLSGSPTTAQFVIVSPHTRHIIAFGAHDGSADDPLFIRWASQNSFTDWTPAVTNSAGDIRVDVGSALIGAIELSNGDIAFWTDEAMYLMQYVGPDFIWRTDLIGTQSGIIGPHAAATWGDLIWYMGKDTFFFYDGRVEILKCDVESHVFDDINMQQKDKFHASINREWTEVVFFYASSTSENCDRYVAYNFVDGNWNIGELDRVTFADASEYLNAPYAYDNSGVLYQHEVQSSAPTGVFLESGSLQIQKGNSFGFVDRAIPDFERITGSVDFKLLAKQYPQSTVETTKGPFTINGMTNKINLRSRGRQWKVRLESEAADWRLSTFRLDAKPDGRR